MTIASLLPKKIKNKLFGERDIYGKSPFPGDPDWQEWLTTYYYKFYQDTQKRGVSKIVNHSGYKILRNIPLQGKTVLEIGPGDLPHIAYWKQRPSQYIVCDIREDFIIQSQKRLQNLSISTSGLLINSPQIELPDQSVDIVIGFYVLEHLHPIEAYLDEILRVLKPNGLLVAGIPTEGGLGWGLGRYFSSRRYIRRTSKLNPDKLICWEHPNFAVDLLHLFHKRMKRIRLNYWPFVLPFIDFNLIISFIFQKK